MSGSCPYGKRCCFIHTELPASGGPPGADGAPPPANTDGRARSSSTNSDPNEPSSSLLARISAKRTHETAINSGPGSVSTTPPSAGVAVSGRPGSLRVNTDVADPAISKQNKSAYPTFAHNGILMSSGEETGGRSPGPVTAGPDFGRHASSRLDIVGSQVCACRTFMICDNTLLRKVFLAAWRPEDCREPQHAPLVQRERHSARPRQRLQHAHGSEPQLDAQRVSRATEDVPD